MNTAIGQRSGRSPSLFGTGQRSRRDLALSLAQYFYQKRTTIIPLQTPSSSCPLSIVCISDTHTTQPVVPDGDLLLHAGDLTNSGSFEELQAQINWLKSLPHKHKIVIAGNHDRLLDPAYVDRFPDRICEGIGTSRSDLDWGDVVYLNNSSAHLNFDNGRTLTVYGSPWTPLCGTFAFQYPDIRPVWHGAVPPNTDILLTHGPPKGHLDDGGKGCPQLLQEIWRTRPRLVVFGHIHPGHGIEHVEFDTFQGAYDAVVTGDKGLLAVLLMACLWIGERLWTFMTSRQNKRCRTSRGTTLVNAAVVVGRNYQVQPAIVVSI
ncbi:hypothetical protein VTK73DRAFT_3607 [Phialemonium thermophilum]|uniref:Calcineurin-like phosphoesterase domain-containing protein n=1 Tax=Phialemonium thermophilum TaxID=223376 RepID=A0ABR3WXZ1_9PEZI